MTCKPTPQNCGNEFKKLIKKLAGSKSRKIKKLGAWKNFEFLIKKKLRVYLLTLGPQSGLASCYTLII